VAVDGAKNAGILAAQILSIADASLREKIKAYKADLNQQVLAKVDKLAKKGWKS
jgi:5-(carboxyamino)imidazole ribonucleotide mutase